MKRILLLLSFCITLSTWAQVTTDPAFPTADTPVTIIYDATKGSGGLKDVSQVYMHAGAVVGSQTGTAWTNVVGNWGKADGVGAMTKDGTNPNIWRITLTPRTYFNIAAGTPLYRIGMVFREAGPCGATGQPACKEGKSASNQDIFVDLFAAGLQVNFTVPQDTFLLVEPNSSIAIQTTASKTSTLKLYNSTQLLTQADNSTSLAYNLTVGTSGSGTVKIQAIAGSETKEDSFQFLVKTPAETAAAPAGTRDGINYKSATSVILQLYAPQKQTVYAIGDFNSWTPSAAAQMKRTPDGNRFWIELTGLTSGQEYGFQYLMDGNVRTGDPYCDKILDPMDVGIKNNYPNLKAYPTGKTTGTVSVFQTSQTAYNWQVPTFQRPTADKLVIYELLVRDFLGTRWYKHLSDTLTYLKRLGINAIELMPIQEFSGNDSWGYNPTYFFAPDKAYGTKNDLKAFIDKCHENGIAVILDMVLNHADYEFPYVKMYWDGSKPTATSPYFNPQATHPFSVFYDFNHESAATQALVDTVNRYWLREYRIDGFRFDLSKGFTQKNTGNDVGAWSAKDDSRIALLKRMYDRIRALDPSAYVILEHLAVNDEEKILADYGMMLWGNMHPNYKEVALGYDNSNANLSWTSYKQRGWTAPRAIPYMESHDEERLMYDQLQYGNTNGTYNTKELATALDRMKLATVLYFSIPGPKMIWQFGELGYDISINENGRTGAKPVLWNYYKEANRLKLYKVYAEMLKLRALQTVFHTDDFSLSVDNTVIKTIQLNSLNQKVLVVANTDVKKNTPTVTFQQGGTWYDYFTGTAVTVEASGSLSLPLEAGEFHIFTTQRLPLPEANLVPNWGGITGIEDDRLNLSTNLYPNPVTSQMQITVQNDTRTPLHLKLTDLQGRVLHQVSATKTSQVWQYSWDMRSYAAGMYMLEITDGRGKITKRVLKQ